MPPPLKNKIFIPKTGSGLFDRILPAVLRREGLVFEDDPRDPGGATKWGISLRFLKGLPVAAGDLDGDGDVDADDIRNASPEQLVDIYFRQIWAPAPHVVGVHDDVAAATFDARVNVGPRRAVILIQRALVAMGHAIVVDGVCGSKTMTALRAAPVDPFLEALCIQWRAFYRRLAEEEPKLGCYLEGWLNRAEDACAGIQ
ncbi:PG_binding_3 domain-containing protein [Azospirillaceae bacterium]